MNKYNKIATLFILLISASQIFCQQISRIKYIEMYKDIAIKQMRQSGIPASIILAQACLESGDGNSRLATEANNHFGIKCHDWKGDRIFHDDDKKGECFRKYRHAEESFKDHSAFLTGRERYRSLFRLDPKDYKAWAYGLKMAGYATNPSYPQLLIKIIEEFSLYKYDTGEWLGEASLTTFPAEPSTTLKSSKLYQFSLSREIFTNNRTAFILAKKGESLESIAKEYQLFTKELMRFNDIKTKRDLIPGEIIYLERKSAFFHGDSYNHTVTTGENLRIVSQKYGIRLKRLAKINNLSIESSVVEGQTLKLR